MTDEQQQKGPEWNERYQDYYYLARVEMYLAGKYVDGADYSRFIASNKIHRAISEGTGYIEERRDVVGKEQVLRQIVDDMRMNVSWKPRSTAAHKSDITSRPGMKDQYQRDLDQVRGI